ncbi:MAG: tetratricopeptide repeat protein [Micropepsaceae bacterium]
MMGNMFAEQLAAGQLLLNARNPEGAIKHLQAALAIDPNNPQALTTLAACQFDTKKLNQARSSADAAVAAAPNFTAAHRVLGMIATAQGQPAIASLHLHKALELDSSDAVSHACLINFLTSQQQHHEAAAAADTAMKLSADSPALLSSIASAYSNTGRIDDAERIARHAYTIAPNHPGALNAVGYVELRRGRIEAANELANLAVAAAPRDPTTLKLYAMVQMRRSTLLAPLWFAVIWMSWLSVELRMAIYIALVICTLFSVFGLPAPYHAIVGMLLAVVTISYILCQPIAGAIIKRSVARNLKPTSLRKSF